MNENKHQARQYLNNALDEMHSAKVHIAPLNQELANETQVIIEQIEKLKSKLARQR
jgi:hypothetical protein